jgi:hypothetical protein
MSLLKTFVRDPNDPLCFCEPMRQCGFCYHAEHGKFPEHADDGSVNVVLDMFQRAFGPKDRKEDERK